MDFIGEKHPMQGETGERWKELCAQAGVEKDPDRLMVLIREINDLLEAKDNRFNKRAPDIAQLPPTTPLKSERNKA